MRDADHGGEVMDRTVGRDVDLSVGGERMNRTVGCDVDISVGGARIDWTVGGGSAGSAGGIQVAPPGPPRQRGRRPRSPSVARGLTINGGGRRGSDCRARDSRASVHGNSVGSCMNRDNSRVINSILEGPPLTSSLLAPAALVGRKTGVRAGGRTSPSPSPEVVTVGLGLRAVGEDPSSAGFQGEKRSALRRVNSDDVGSSSGRNVAGANAAALIVTGSGSGGGGG